jgi:hypothetical protein
MKNLKQICIWAMLLISVSVVTTSCSEKITEADIIGKWKFIDDIVVVETSQPSLDAQLTREYTEEYNFSGQTFEFTENGSIKVGSQTVGSWSLYKNSLKIDIGYGYVTYDVVIKNNEANLKADMRDFYAADATYYGITLYKATLELIFRRV